MEVEERGRKSRGWEEGKNENEKREGFQDDCWERK